MYHFLVLFWSVPDDYKELKLHWIQIVQEYYIELGKAGSKLKIIEHLKGEPNFRSKDMVECLLV